MKLNKRNPNDPAVTARILERLRQISAEETLALLKWRPEGVEETNMTDSLAIKKNNKQSAPSKHRAKVA